LVLIEWDKANYYFSTFRPQTARIQERIFRRRGK